MQIFAFAASDNPGSLNRHLLAQAASFAADLGANVAEQPYERFDCPSYSDLRHSRDGQPEGAKRLAAALAACDAVMIASPEYNWSYPGSLKNILDWVSRLKPTPFAGKPCLLLSASPSLHGGVRGLAHLRAPLEALGAYVYPQSFSLYNAAQSLDAKGRITVPLAEKDLRQRVTDFIDFAGKLSSSA